MNTAVISSLADSHKFESKLKDLAKSERNNEDISDDEICGKEEVPSTQTSEAVLQPAAPRITNVASSNTKSGKRMLPLVYIQAPNKLKVPTAITSTGNTSNPQIIVNGNQQFQISTLNPKLNVTAKANTSMSSVVLTHAGNNSKSQPIIIQKSATGANGQTLIPVSVATSTGTKQTYAYLGAIIKPQGGVKTSEGQIVVPTNHLPAGLIPAPTSQKLLLAPMNMPKLTTKLPVTYSTASANKSKLPNLILPMSLSSQIKNASQSVINFKIANGQIQSDPKGSITVLCDNKTLGSKERAKQDISDSEITETKLVSNETVSADSTSEKPLSEKTYELSIAEVPTSKCELSYTISIPDDEGKSFNPTLKGTVTSETKKSDKEDLGNLKSIVKEQMVRKPLHEVSILKKCNLNAIDRKSDTVLKPRLLETQSNEVSSEHKSGSTDNDSANVSTSSESKPQTTEVRKVAERRRKSQYTYLRDYDEVVVTSGNAWENKPSEKYKQFQSAEITLTKLSCTDDDVKDKDIKKSMEDVIEIELVKQELPQFSTEDDQDIRTALKWKDGIGFLPGSKLKFHINEFGFIEMLVGEEYEKMKTVKPKEEKEEPLNGDEILCCSECGCYGMPSEFISRSYCSKTCKMNGTKMEAKRAYLQDSKAKRKKKKMALMQKQKSESELSPKMEYGLNTNPAHSDDENSNDMSQDKVNYPWQCGKKGFTWSKYLDHVKAKAAPIKLFKDPFPYTKNGFRPGMKLEGIDPQHPSYFCVMTVSHVQGYRMRLHFDGYPDNYDFWVNADSMDIFPIGWCEKFNHILHPPPHISPIDFNWTTYLKQCKASAAPKHLFANRAGNSVCPNGFRLGMKLEAVDKKNASLICVATVQDQMDNRFLVHFDSWDDIYDYWADPSSPYIHPVGWCDQYGHNLTPPNDYPNPESFTWEKYLKETKSTAAPVRAFKQRPSNGFRREMRLECVDKRVPSLIRVATVDDVRDHQIKVRFDGWPSKYSYWIDDDSPDIHPSGWCQKTGHPLESPLTPEDVYEQFECPTVGCKGLGHVRGPRTGTHTCAKDCPYSDDNLNVEFVLPDRLSLTDQDFVQEAVIPVSREPRDKSKTPVCRPTKIRRLTETSIKSEWATASEDDSPEGGRKRKLVPSRENMTSPTFHNKVKIIPEEMNRFKLLSNNEFQSCPSQQVLAKHSKLLSDLVSTSQQDPRTWSQEEVAEFVGSLPSCKEHSMLFISHKVDGEAFLMLTQKDLVDILKFKLGPAIKLYNSIVMLRQNVTFYN